MKLFFLLLALVTLGGCYNAESGPGHWQESTYKGKVILCRYTAPKIIHPIFECIDADLPKVKP